MRRQNWTAYGLIGLFLALYGVSLELPGLVFGHRNDLSEQEAIYLLERGATCSAVNAGPVHLSAKHELLLENGAKFSSVHPQPIACSAPGELIANNGYYVLTFGWLGALGGVFAWYANVLALVALVFGLIGGTPKTASAFAAGAVLLGLDAFPVVGAYLPDTGPTIKALGSGYYVWEVSLMVLFLSQVVTIRTRRGARPISGTMEP